MGDLMTRGDVAGEMAPLCCLCRVNAADGVQHAVN